MTSTGSLPRNPARRADAPRSRGAGVLDAAVLPVIERAAAFPRGLALLHRAPLECAAVLIAAPPDVVARARAALEDAATRAAALEHFARAVRDGGESPATDREAVPRPRTAEELVRAASQQPGQADVLASASLECAAIAFGVHPEIVLAARALVGGRERPARRGEQP